MRAGKPVNLAVAHPWVLTLLPLAFLPFCSSSFRSQPFPWVEVIPRDVISTVIDHTLRVIAALAIASLILGIGGLHRIDQTVQRIGLVAADVRWIPALVALLVLVFLYGMVPRMARWL